MEILLKRGTSTALDNYNGKYGEVAIDTDNNHIRLFDNKTNGGLVIANKDDIPTKLSQLQNDTNFSNINPNAYVIETGSYGNAWWMKYSNGWCIQGDCWSDRQAITATLFVPMKDVYYSAVFSQTPAGTDSSNYAPGLERKTTTSCRFQSMVPLTVTIGYIVCGWYK